MTTARLARWCQRANGPLTARKINNYTVKLKRQSGLMPLTCVKVLRAGDGNRTRMTSLEGTRVCRSATSVGSCDQEIYYLHAATLPSWVEIWVEIRRYVESMQAGAA